MKTFSSLALIFVLLTGLFGALPVPAVYAATVPTFDVTAAVTDSQVSIKTANFPANKEFDVRMGKIGTLGVNGVLVSKVSSGSGGTFTATFTIPAELKGQGQIAIRLEDKRSGYYSYNWFNNTTFGTIAGTAVPTVAPGTTSTPATPTKTPTKNPGSTAVPGATATPRATTVFPTFTITAVDADNTVTIRTSNLPANLSFDVRMGKMWTQGVNGTLVTTIESGSGGAQTLTFTIPEGLKGQSQISIRLESKSRGFYAYNWFYNSDAG